jgi:UDP-N-acetyl-D-galactosamine dehydrogenase|tara:strand:+ start:772 stop:2046 length:1275 start_codon:yes stop_codon:yes gene_type:complete
MNINDFKIAVIGLGYVGLPLASKFGESREVIGYDINSSRIEELRSGYDSTLELSHEELSKSKHLIFLSNPEKLRDCNFYIITVPTPIDVEKKPDLTPLISATRLIGKYLSKGDYIVYESTVYPGATEEVCIPILEAESKLIFNIDFFAGYSPERINPGDKEHTLTNITKVTSGSTPESAILIDDLYQTIIEAGTYRASSIKVAEAAKIIENTQRDVNIALINELSIIFHKLGIDTNDVLEAASTKWNFLPFQPGLVGGHCIGVDPYYLTHKAQSLGYDPQIILAGRRLNDSMGHYVAQRLQAKMLEKKIEIQNSNTLIMGLTFKENCPDIRNTKVTDVVRSLQLLQSNVDIYDPWVDESSLTHLNEVNIVQNPKLNYYDAIIITVPHKIFLEYGMKTIKSYGKSQHIIFDVKYLFPAHDSDMQL